MVIGIQKKMCILFTQKELKDIFCWPKLAIGRKVHTEQKKYRISFSSCNLKWKLRIL